MYGRKEKEEEIEERAERRERRRDWVVFSFVVFVAGGASLREMGSLLFGVGDETILFVNITPCILLCLYRGKVRESK